MKPVGPLWYTISYLQNVTVSAVVCNNHCLKTLLLTGHNNFVVRKQLGEEPWSLEVNVPPWLRHSYYRNLVLPPPCIARNDENLVS